MSEEMVEIRGLEGVMRKLERSLWHEPALRLLRKAGISVQNEARKLAPVDTGLLRSSIASEVREDLASMQARIGTSVFYAPFQEYGTGTTVGKGRHWPPGEALGLWAARHGFSSGFAVAQIIGEHGGLSARRYLRGGLDAAKEAIGGYLQEMWGEIKARWEGR